MTTLAKTLFTAVAASLDQPDIPVRVIVPDIRQAILTLTSINHTGVASLGNTVRCDVWDDLHTWKIELIAAEPQTLRDRINTFKDRPAVFMPVAELVH